MARTAKKTTKKKTSTRKKATAKKATTSKKKTTKKKLPEAPPVELFKNNVATPPPVSQRPVARRAMAPSTRTKVVVKKPIYKNVELFKKYFDMALGVLMSTVVGTLCLSAFFGVLFFFKEASTWHLQFPKVFIFFSLAYLVGYVMRAED